MNRVSWLIVSLLFCFFSSFPLRMIRRSKWLARKEIRIPLLTQQIQLYREPNSTLTRCGYTIVERIVMSKRKASEPLLGLPKKRNRSTDFVYY